MNVPMDVPTDERLIEAALSGDDEAFTELVRKHKRKVMKIAARFAKSDFELDDVCQEIFIKVYKNLKEYRNDAPFEHWLSKIAVNACYDLLRKRYREGNTIRLDDIPMLQSDLAAEEIADGLAWEVLRHALERLRPEERLVVTLLNLEEKSIREISALTGWSEANVKVRAFRARKELKRILEDTNGKRSQ
jgi:RNA polymerase sigma-70 factor, ECF subfamily